MAWPRITDLITEGAAEIALLGAPMGQGSVTPGRCDLAPAAIREALRRFSRYDVETREELSLAVRDAGDVAVQAMMPAEGFAPIRDAVAGLHGGA